MGRKKTLGKGVLGAWMLIGVLFSSSPGEVEAKLSTVVSIPPQASLVKGIGGSAVSVVTLLGRGEDPHTFSPSPQQIKQLTSANLFFSVGLSFEQRLLEKIADGEQAFSVVDTTQGVYWRKLDGHAYRGERPHLHERDPHIWLAPSSIRKVVAVVFKALVQRAPRLEKIFTRNRRDYEKRLDRLDKEIRSRLSPYKGKPIYLSHPILGYFADEYGLDQKALEQHGKRPSPRQIQGLIRQARADGIRTIFVEPQFDRRGAEVVARAIEGKLVEIDPMAHDLLANLEAIAGKVEKALHND